MNDYDLQWEAMAVGKAIELYGGSFVKGLLVAMRSADIHNLRKIKGTWPDEWAQYLHMYQIMEDRKKGGG